MTTTGSDKAKHWWTRFWRDTRADTAIIFALSLIPMLLATGMAYDYSRAITFKARLQSALDAGALAAAASGKLSDKERKNLAMAAFEENVGTAADRSQGQTESRDQGRQGVDVGGCRLPDRLPAHRRRQRRQRGLKRRCVHPRRKDGGNRAGARLFRLHDRGFGRQGEVCRDARGSDQAHRRFVAKRQVQSGEVRPRPLLASGLHLVAGRGRGWRHAGQDLDRLHPGPQISLQS